MSEKGYSLELTGEIDLKKMDEDRELEESILWEEFEEYRKCREQELAEEIHAKREEIANIYEEIEILEKKAKCISETKNPYQKHKIRESTRLAALERDGHRCRECGKIAYLEVHHIIYRSNGGTDAKSNLITLCDACHAKRHKDEQVYPLMMKKVLSRRDL